MKCCEIGAGDLRHKIFLNRLALTTDEGGGQSKAWVEYAGVWAFIKPVTSRETLAGMKLEHVITHDIIIRYRTNIVASDKVVYNEREFNIVSIINIEERNIWLQLRCEEGRAV